MAPKSTWETFHFVITIGVCIFLGQKADIYFDSTPIFTLIGIILGVITAVYTDYRKKSSDKMNFS